MRTGISRIPDGTPLTVIHSGSDLDIDRIDTRTLPKITSLASGVPFEQSFNLLPSHSILGQ